ncbi:MAG: TonB-dependent receptor [Imperialibacter sp.]|uniref:TonB-dependent receptor n=1 Tax=Imperialibacter sp. TaxID=2038411 RepID=UPI0032F089D4
MKRSVFYVFFFGILFFVTGLSAQSILKVSVLDADTQEPLVGATIQIAGTTQGTITDLNGEGQITVPGTEPVSLLASFVGYSSQRKKVVAGMTELVFNLEPEEELEEVIVTATRSSRTIEDIPIRMEVISGEELDEKAAMNSTNIAMLLRESSGIQMQQTSTNSANQTLRIQGLDGRYTQLLRDGLPLYGGFSSGLSIMQIPPLDLRQVEVIKGSASTLYGGGAIAGLVNLVSKTPGDEPERSIMLNQTTAGGTTLNTFLSGRHEKKGFTLYASANRQQPYDPNNDDFSDIPRVRSIALNPKIFFYPSERTTLSIGLNSSYEAREGGDIAAIENEGVGGRSFSEENYTGRLGSLINFVHTTSNGSQWSFKNSVNLFARNIDSPIYSFYGEQLASFSELAYNFKVAKHELVTGMNLVSDNFSDPGDNFMPGLGDVDRSYNFLTAGVFAQDTWEVSEQNTLELGLRTDFNNEYGAVLLPRLSWMVKPSKQLTMRLGGGRGYKLPTIFLEEAEQRAFTRVLPYNAVNQQPEMERSWGSNFDVNFRTALGDDWTLSANQLFFVTQLDKPVFLDEAEMAGFTNYYLSNRQQPVVSKGFESNLKLGYDHWKLFLQYSLSQVDVDDGSGYRQKAITPKHAAGFVVMYEKHESFRIGYELYYTGSQYRYDRSSTPDFWIMGIMAMKEWEKFSVFLNFENFTDTRQSRYQSMVTPPYNNPAFAEVWAPTDGFVSNGGFIFHF